MLAMPARCALAFLILSLFLACAGPGHPGAWVSERAASARLSSTADLNGKRIGVLMGSVYDAFATKTYPLSTILQFDTPADLQLAVLTGKVDAGLSDEQPIREAMRT